MRGIMGIPLLEIAISLAIVLIAIGSGFYYFNRYQGDLEHFMFDQQIMNMRSGLRLHIAANLLKSQDSAALVGINPITLLEEPPENYAGETGQGAAEPDALPGWQFDTSKRRLIYQVAHPAAFQGHALLAIEIRQPRPVNPAKPVTSEFPVLHVEPITAGMLN